MKHKIIHIYLYSCLQEWLAVLSDEDEQEDADETLADWAKLETMRSSHPMHFAKKLAEVDINVKCSLYEGAWKYLICGF